jgi:hypothetical protein
MYSHSLQRIIDRLSLLANALSTIGRLLFQLCNARLLALFQPLGVDGRQNGRLLLRRCQGCDLEVLDPRDGDDVVVAGVAGSGGACVDGHDIEDRAGGEEGALEGLRLGRGGGGELDAGEVFGLVSCHVLYVRTSLQQRQAEQACEVYRTGRNIPCSNCFAQRFRVVHRSRSVCLWRRDPGGLGGIGHGGGGETQV